MNDHQLCMKIPKNAITLAYFLRYHGHRHILCTSVAWSVEVRKVKNSSRKAIEKTEELRF